MELDKISQTFFYSEVEAQRLHVALSSLWFIMSAISRPGGLRAFVRALEDVVTRKFSVLCSFTATEENQTECGFQKQNIAGKRKNQLW